MEKRIFYKEKKGDTIWWVYYPDMIGNFEVSFDKKKIYNLFADYPHNFTKEEKAIFDKENPYWADFVNGIQKCSDFGNKTAVFSASMMQ